MALYGRNYFGLWIIMGMMIGFFVGTGFQAPEVGLVAGGGLGLLYAWLKSRKHSEE